MADRSCMNSGPTMDTLKLLAVSLEMGMDPESSCANAAGLPGLYESNSFEFGCLVWVASQ